MRRLALLVLLIALLATACGDASVDEGSGDDLAVVVTTSVLGDLTGTLVGRDGETTVLMQAGVDPHSYQLSAAQAALLRSADLVIANGLDLEATLGDALEAAEEDGARVVRVGERLDPRTYRDDDGAVDPHVWLDPVRMAEGVRVIGAALADVDERLEDREWADRADALAADLLSVHDEIVDMLAPIPAQRRLLVTNHDSLGYFADRYGFEILGTVVPGASTQAATNPAGFADLAALVRDRGVPAIFAETTDSDRLARALAEEVGREIQVVDLYTGSLSDPDGPAPTYLDLLRYDARAIADALT